MPTDQHYSELAELSYLWTSGEWELRKHHQSSATVIFDFAGDTPTPSEILAVRALLPQFRDSPMSELKEVIGLEPHYVAGEFGGIEARDLAAAALKRGLRARLDDTSRTGYLPVNKKGHALIIENDELAELATGEMLRQGVPVVSHTEAD